MVLFSKATTATKYNNPKAFAKILLSAKISKEGLNKNVDNIKVFISYLSVYELKNSTNSDNLSFVSADSFTQPPYHSINHPLLLSISFISDILGRSSVNNVAVCIVSK